MMWLKPLCRRLSGGLTRTGAAGFWVVCTHCCWTALVTHSSRKTVASPNWPHSQGVQVIRKYLKNRRLHSGCLMSSFLAVRLGARVPYHVPATHPLHPYLAERVVQAFATSCRLHHACVWSQRSRRSAQWRPTHYFHQQKACIPPKGLWWLRRDVWTNPTKKMTFVFFFVCVFMWNNSTAEAGV